MANDVQSGGRRRPRPDETWSPSDDQASRLLDAGELDYAFELAEALVDRAITDGTGTYWRFIEHRTADPMLPPGAGWMQGAAGIAADTRPEPAIWARNVADAIGADEPLKPHGGRQRPGVRRFRAGR